MWGQIDNPKSQELELFYAQWRAEIDAIDFNQVHYKYQDPY